MVHQQEADISTQVWIAEGDGFNIGHTLERERKKHKKKLTIYTIFKL